MSLKGGCLCGQVTYASTGEPLATLVCHCRNCQKQAGTAFSVIAVVPAGTLTVSGELKSYLDTADSGNVLERQFCPQCGSPVFSVPRGNPGITAIKAGTLDDPGRLKPAAQIWCASAQPWLPDLANLPRFERNLPA